MKTIAESLAEFAFDMSDDAIPESVRRRAAHLILDDADIVAKFTDNAQLAASAAQAETVREIILNLDALDDARKLANALSAGSKT